MIECMVIVAVAEGLSGLMSWWKQHDACYLGRFYCGRKFEVVCQRTPVEVVDYIVALGQDEIPALFICWRQCMLTYLIMVLWFMGWFVVMTLTKWMIHNTQNAHVMVDGRWLVIDGWCMMMWHCASVSGGCFRVTLRWTWCENELNIWSEMFPLVL